MHVLLIDSFNNCMHGLGVGLDIGTSKISVGINNDGECKQLQFGDSDVFPCCIYYNNKKCYGEDAILEGQRDPKYCFYNLKSLIGRSESDGYVSEIKKHVSYSIVPGRKGEVMVEVCENGKIVDKNPTELLSMLVNHVIDRVRERMNCETINYLAIGYPPSFTEDQKKELETIGEQTKISTVYLYSEPIVICRYYSGGLMRSGETTLVIDCGAGRFDATILKCQDGCSFDVIGHTGIDTIGGERYTQSLMDYICERSKGITVRELSPKEKFSWRGFAESIIVCRGIRDSVTINTDDSSESFSIDLEELWKDYNDEIVRSLQKLLDDKRCTLNHVVISGKGMLLNSLKTSICNVLHKDLEVMANEPVAGGLALSIKEISNNHQESYNSNPNPNSNFDPMYPFPGSEFPPSIDVLFQPSTNSDYNRNARNDTVIDGESTFPSNNSSNHNQGQNPHHQINERQSSTSSSQFSSAFYISSDSMNGPIPYSSSSSSTRYRNSDVNGNARNDLNPDLEKTMELVPISPDQSYCCSDNYNARNNIVIDGESKIPSNYFLNRNQIQNPRHQINDRQSSISSSQFSSAFYISSDSMNGPIPSYSSALNEDVLVFSRINS